MSETATSVDGRPLSKRGERTRRKLLEAAEAVFAELGYHDASIVKITEAAGVGQGTSTSTSRARRTSSTSSSSTSTTGCASR